MNPLDQSDSNSSQLQTLSAEVDSLRAFFGLLLALTLLVTGSLCFFLFRQTSLLSRPIVANKLSIAQMEDERIKLFNALNELKAFGLKAPDYAQILNKYGLKPEPLPSGAAATPLKK